MSHIVSQNHTDLTIAIVDDYMRRIPQRNRRQARDYLYEDRLICAMSMPGRLIAELRGYHDSYISYFELSQGSWQGGCTCRHASCSHLTALLIHFSEHPELFVFPPQAIEEALQRPWSFFPDDMPGLKILRLMPDPVPWWMKKRQEGQNKFDTQKIDTLEDFLGHPAMLADLHPSWLDESRIRQGILQWSDRHLIRRAGFPFWLKLWAYNPYLPLESVFSTFSEDIEGSVPLIVSLLFSASLVPFPLDRTWHRVHRLLSLLEPIRSVPILWLWNQFEDLDPIRLSRTHALMVREGAESAIQYIEQNWPTESQDQHIARRALINWLPPEKKLPYWTAECLESGSREDLHALQTILDAASYRNLKTVFNTRWASSAEP